MAGKFSLSEPIYEEFSLLSRSEHLDGVVLAYRNSRFSPQRLVLPGVFLRNKVVWFSIGLDLHHNQYGNVTFSIPLKSLMATLGSNVYCISQEKTKGRTLTKLLITRSLYENKTLEKCSLNRHGDPVVMGADTVHFAVKSLNGKSLLVHEIHIAVECDEKDGKWLYETCHKSVNDHFCVNVPLVGKKEMRSDGKLQRYKKGKCFKFNTSLNTLCPYQFLRDQVKEKLASKCPNLWIKEEQEIIQKAKVRYPISKASNSNEVITENNDNISVLSKYSRDMNIQTLDSLLVGMKLEDIDGEFGMTGDIIGQHLSPSKSKTCQNPSKNTTEEEISSENDIDVKIDQFLTSTKKNLGSNTKVCKCFLESTFGVDEINQLSTQEDIEQIPFEGANYTSTNSTSSRDILNKISPSESSAASESSKPKQNIQYQLMACHKKKRSTELSNSVNRTENYASKTFKQEKKTPNRTLFRETYSSSLKTKKLRDEERPEYRDMTDVPDTSYYRLAAYPSLI